MSSDMTAYAPCPKCRGSNAAPVKFTWWGGVLGPKLLKHVKCSACGHAYNGKTGKDNTTGILIYFAVIGALAFIVMFMIFFAIAVMQVAK
jgi:hypothetical protein